MYKYGKKSNLDCILAWLTIPGPSMGGQAATGEATGIHVKS